jgi:hypothetical protein
VHLILSVFSTRFSGHGPGLQKKNKLAKKYGQGKNKCAHGSFAELDFGVEVAEVRV